MSTLRINNIEAQSIPASPTIDEKVKVTNSSGDILVNIDGKTSGITTIGINTTDGNIKFDANSNVLITGILTATTLSGNFTPTSLEIGSNIKLGNAGVITATSFVGSGANLTGIPAQATIANNADNRVITGGSGVNLNGEANVVVNGGRLGIGVASPDVELHVQGAGDGIPDLINTGTDFAGNINLDGGIASSLYGIEETLGGTNTTLFAVGDQMSDGSNPPLSPTVSVAGELGDGDVHVAQVDFLFRSHTTGNYVVGETVVGSITGITGIVTAWDAATKTLSIGSTIGNSGNFLWNDNETITGNGSGIVGTIQKIYYPSSVRNEPD